MPLAEARLQTRETMLPLYPTIRPGARYYQSLRLLDRVKQVDPSIFTKSGLMVGLGEARPEIGQVMDDLRIADVDFLTIGQYLQPTVKHAAVDRYVTPEEFEDYAVMARAKGFLQVSATPLTRSSSTRMRISPRCGRRGRNNWRGCSRRDHPREQRIVRYSPAQLFALVADVAKYPSFLPWCVGARIRSHVANDLVADLTIGFGPFGKASPPG